jgi:hypothetical protein
MRNFSMKKFGTPMRAGPGVASESVGFSSVGEPSVLRAGFLRSTRFLLLVSSSAPPSASAFGSSERSSPTIRGRLPTRLRDSPGAAGAGCAPPSEPPAPCWTDGSCVGAGVAGVDDAVGAAVGSGDGVGVGVGVSTGPRSVIDRTGAGRSGIVTYSTDEPGGTSMTRSIVSPVTSVIETRRSSADAGTTSTPNRAAAASPMTSFRRLI